MEDEKKATVSLEAGSYLAKILRASPSAVLLRRISDGRIIEVNDRFLQLTGRTREEIIGKHPLETGCVTADGLGRWERGATLGRTNDALELWFTRKTGEVRIAIGAVEIVDFDGPCRLAMFVDVTDRTLAERRLAAQHAVSRALAESVAIDDAAPRVLRALCDSEGWDVGTMWTVNGDALRCLSVWQRPDVSGLEELVAITRTMSMAKGEGVAGRVWETGEPAVVLDVSADRTFLRGPAAARAGMRTAVALPVVVRGNVVGVFDLIGRESPIDAQLSELLSAVGGQFGSFVERSEAVASIRRNEGRLEAVIANLSEGLVLVDPETGTYHWNPAAQELLGFQPTDHPGLDHLRALFEFTNLDGSALEPSQWPVAQITRGETLRQYELRIRRRDIDWSRVFSYGGSLVTHGDGARLVLLTFRDVSERIRREELKREAEELAEENRRIQERSQMKSEFLANMSHELRTPLNAIIGFTSLLHSGRAGGTLSATHREYLAEVLASANHLLQVITDILDLAKVEHGRYVPAPTEVDVGALLKQVHGLLRGLAAVKKMRITIDADPSIDVVVIDPRMTKQILFNFLSNAIKFTPQHGTISLRTVRSGRDRFRVEVEDNGIGIAPHDIDRLFRDFEQLDGAADGQHRGTGLGLALSRRLAQAQHGDTGVTSTKGVGSCFFVELPCVVGTSGRSLARTGE